VAMGMHFFVIQGAKQLGRQRWYGKAGTEGTYGINFLIAMQTIKKCLILHNW